MQVFFGLILGAFGGYFLINNIMKKRLYSIFVKMGFSDSEVSNLMEHYTNYDKYQKEAKKKQHEQIMKLEMDYRNRKL
jgi:uncharacterized protein YneF (UPF0154 family)